MRVGLGNRYPGDPVPEALSFEPAVRDKLLKDGWLIEYPDPVEAAAPVVEPTEEEGKCGECQRVFKNKRALNAHSRAHKPGTA